jgi:hypothetical protein
VQPRSAAGYGSEHLHKGRRDNVGKGHRPTGTGDNLQRPGAQGESRGAGRGMVWRMSPYERRRGGNAPPGGLEVAPARVTPVPGKGALGTRWPRTSGTHQTQSWVTRGLHRGEGARQTPPRRGEGCASTAVSRAGGRPALRNGVQSRGQNRTREIRPSGIEEGLQETWPVGALISTRRARLISISTTACTDRCGGGRKPDQSGQHVPRGPGASRRPYKNPD